MASGHVNRINRPNTWLHRPMLQNAKKALANTEPSTHGRHQPGIVTKRCEFAAQVMCADAGFHADQARRYIGEPRFHLATRPLLPQHDGATRIVAHEVERVLADIDADHGDRSIELLRHRVLLVFGAPCQLRLLAGQEHDRTIPLPDIDCGRAEEQTKAGAFWHK